jgi:hypothetical protein
MTSFCSKFSVWSGRERQPFPRLRQSAIHIGTAAMPLRLLLAVVSAGSAATLSMASRSMDYVGSAFCETTAAPHGFSAGTSRVGGTVVGIVPAVTSPEDCAAACCVATSTVRSSTAPAAIPCRSWNYLQATQACELLSGYSRPSTNASVAASGVVYRPAPNTASGSRWLQHPAEVPSGAQSSLLITNSSSLAGVRGFNYLMAKSVNDLDFWRDYDPLQVR